MEQCQVAVSKATALPARTVHRTRFGIRACSTASSVSTCPTPVQRPRVTAKTKECQSFEFDWRWQLGAHPFHP